MKRILSMELKKAFWNKRFLFSLSVALFLSLLSGFLQVRGYIIRTRFLNTPAYQNVADWGKDYHLSAETMADFWIGMDFSTWCATAFSFYYHCWLSYLMAARSTGNTKAGILI